MAKFQEEGQIYDEINVVPMLDLAFVLIVIFILLATAAVAGIKVNLPQASNQENLSQSQTRAVTIKSDGQIYLDGYPMSKDDLRREMQRAHAANPEVPVVIRGDGDTAYARVMEVLDLLKGIGITKIGLPARELTT